MKKVVIISPEIPYPVFKGNQSRIDLTIKALIDIGISVSLVCLNSSQKKRASMDVEKDIRHAYPSIDRVVIRRHPKFSFDMKDISYHALKKIKVFNADNHFTGVEQCPPKIISASHKLIHELKPDYVFVNYIKMSPCVPLDYEGERIVDLHDVQANIYKESLKQKGEIINSDVFLDILQAEVKLIDSYDKIISINNNETRFLEEFVESNKILTLPAFGKQKYRKNIEKKYDVMFVGSASPFNVEGVMKFIAKVMPTVKKTLPEISVAIAGDVSTCSALMRVGDPCYSKLGRIASLDDLYSASKIVISPIVSGAGMKVKNVEALSYGMPIVATSFSMNGIFVENGVSSLIADDWDGFARQLIKIIQDDALRSRIEQGASNYFKNNHSYQFAKDFFSCLFLKKKSPSIRVLSASGLKVSNQNPLINRPASNGNRTKALIFSTDAYELISLNIFLAKELEKIKIYSEFVKMEVYGEHQFLNEGFLVHSIKSKMNNKNRERLKKQYVELIDENGEFKQVIVSGVDISEDLRVYKKMFPSHFHKTAASVIAHSVLILDSITAIIDKISPDFLVGWNGNGPHMIFLMKVAAKIKSLPVFHIERGLLPNSIVFDAHGVNFKSVFAGSYLPLINENERKKASAFLETYRKKSESIVKDYSQLSLNKNQINEHFELNGRGYIFFPMQIEGDSNIVLNSPTYKRMIDVVTDLEQVGKNTGLKIVCRPHPENKASIDEIMKKFLCSEIVIIDSLVDLHSMIQSSVATVVINSTVGLESLLHGIPTISLGCSLYSHKGLTFDCASRENIENVVKKIQFQAYSPRVQNEKLERLVHMLIAEYLLFLDGDVVGYDNLSKINSMLTRNSVVVNTNLGLPGKPKKVNDYQRRKKEFFTYIEQKKVPKVTSLLRNDTVQYLNGSKKPAITKKLIKDSLGNIFGKDIELIDKVEDSDVVIVNSDKVKNIPNYIKYTVDEYFDMI